jgi:hypothetical protein
MRGKNVLHEHNGGESLCVVHLFGLQIPKGYHDALIKHPKELMIIFCAHG